MMKLLESSSAIAVAADKKAAASEHGKLRVLDEMNKAWTLFAAETTIVSLKLGPLAAEKSRLELDAAWLKMRQNEPARVQDKLGPAFSRLNQ